MQYFMDMKEFIVEQVFDSSLFVQIRKKAGLMMFDSLIADLIWSAKGEKLIDTLYEVDCILGVNPRTYKRTMDQNYLELPEKEEVQKDSQKDDLKIAGKREPAKT